MTNRRTAGLRPGGPIFVAAAAVACVLAAGCAAPGTGHGLAADGGRTSRGTTGAAATPAAGDGPGKSGPRQSPPSFKVAHPDGSITYSGVGAIVWPAPPRARPLVARQQALTALEKDGIAPGPLGVNGLAPSSIRLVEYENQFGAKASDGKEIPGVPRQLAWFAEYDNLKPGVISVPATLHTTRPIPAEGSPWVAVVVVSATTGKVLDGFSYSA